MKTRLFAALAVLALALIVPHTARAQGQPPASPMPNWQDIDAHLVDTGFGDGTKNLIINVNGKRYNAPLTNTHPWYGAVTVYIYGDVGGTPFGSDPTANPHTCMALTETGSTSDNILWTYKFWCKKIVFCGLNQSPVTVHVHVRGLYDKQAWIGGQIVTKHLILPYDKTLTVPGNQGSGAVNEVNATMTGPQWTDYYNNPDNWAMNTLYPISTDTEDATFGRLLQ